MDVSGLVRGGERVARIQVRRNNQRGIGLSSLAPQDVNRLEDLAECVHLSKLRLRFAVGISETEVQLERMVPVGILARERVVVGVTPAHPASRASKQAVVQHLPVITGRMGSGRKVRADAELLEDYRQPVGAGELALPRGRIMLTNFVIPGRVDMRADEITKPGSVAQRETVLSRHTCRPPGAVTKRERLVTACRTNGIAHYLRPRRDHLPGSAGLAIDRHLVR